MLQTFEAFTDAKGNIQFLEPVVLPAGWRVLITILPESAVTRPETATTRPSASMSSLKSSVGNGTGLVEFFRQSPLCGVELDLERSKDTGREVEL